MQRAKNRMANALRGLMLTSTFIVFSAYADDTIQFDIPSQPLSSAIQLLSEQADVQILYSEKAVEGLTNKSLKGAYTVQEALETLLQGENLHFDFTSPNTVIIKNNDRPNATALENDVAVLDVMTVNELLEQIKGALSTSHEALPSQTYVLDENKIESLPYSRATDLLRSTPGITFGSSSPGSDLGDDISIRGFSSYHGADVAVYVDGVPLNWPNAPMRHGMVDMNWITPEIIERVEIIKGPFSAEYGDFNLAGAINIITKSMDASSAGIEAGSYSEYRAIGTYGRAMGGIIPFLAYEYLDRGGYRDHTGAQRFNAFNKFSFPLADGRLSVRLSASLRDTEAAGFLLVDDVRNGTVNRRSANPDSLNDTGYNDYFTLVANYFPGKANGTTATVYAGHDKFELVDTAFGPPTGVTDGDRNYAGWRVSRTLPWEGKALVTIGTDGLLSNGSVQGGLADSNGNLDLSALSRDQDADSKSIGLYLQGQYRLLDPLKLVGGVRYDYLQYDITNNLFPNSGDVSDSVVSPKIGLVYTVNSSLEFFTNTGKGFRSPADTELSPNRTGAAFNDNLDVAELTSSDVGVVLRPAPGVKVSADYFVTTTERELRRDPNNPVNVINIGETDRDGYELILSWRISDKLNFNAGHTSVDTQIGDPATPGADRVITVPENTQTLNVSWSDTLKGNMPLNVDFFAQRIGPRPLTADGSLMAENQITYGSKVRLARGPLSGYVQLTYAPDDYSSDFVFDVVGGAISYDPRPEIAMLTGIKYTFD